MSSVHPYDDPQEILCKICGNVMDFVDCHCDDGWEEDEDDDDVFCSECGGEGGYLECSALPHTDQQMEAYRARKDEATDGGKAR